MTMKSNLLVLSVLCLLLVASTAGFLQLAESPKPCRIQSVGSSTLRCVVPKGYQVRSGDCGGNDIWRLYRNTTTLRGCAKLCSSDWTCEAFMFYKNHRCYPKRKTCSTTSKSNPLNVFYDKIPLGYNMRAGDCPGYALRDGDCAGNVIWNLHGNVSLTECASRCNSDANCISFMYFDGKKCYPKSKACAQPNPSDNKKVFYDKVPSGYAMRPGDCGGNNILDTVHGYEVSLAECARRCNNAATCIAFVFINGQECFLKTKTCQTTIISHPRTLFYDKISWV